MTRFERELERLDDVYAASQSANNPLTSILQSVALRPAVFAGSGGALAVAEFAAQIHRLATGQPARADTPLSFTANARERHTSAVLFSAGGRNPDVRLGAKAARLAGYFPVVVISCRAEDELPDSLLRHVDTAVHVDAPSDGFLATSSVIAMTTALAIAYGFELPPTLQFEPALSAAPLGDRTIAIGGVLQRSVIVDLEARLAETGLSSIQIADLRNFAHGRHVGLARNLTSTSVVLFSDSGSRNLATATGNLLPVEADQRQISSEHIFPASAIELFGRSMHLTAATGVANDFDPAKPGVGKFGRDLYRLTPGRTQKLPMTGPVDRKLDALSLNRSQYDLVRCELDTWLESMTKMSFTTLVLDYDGTCCATERRYKALDEEIASRLAELSRNGLQIAFASGRGRSLYDEARRWMPQQSWASTWLGLYNGGVILSLADEIGDYTAEDPLLAEAADRLIAHSEPLALTVEPRSTQVGVTSLKVRSGNDLLPIVRGLLSQHPAVEVKIAASGHSVDVVKAGVTKGSIIDHLQSLGAGEVIAIGDQGHSDGNDFELLARTPWSLSVDRVSPDLSRCWNLGVAPERGPDLLVRYLRGMRKTRSGWRFNWKARI